jgi:predicted ferric reductase
MYKHTQTNKQEINQNKQRNTQKYSRFRNNRISIYVVVVLLLQHPVLVLLFQKRLCLSLTTWLGNLERFFFLCICLSVAAA